MGLVTLFKTEFGIDESDVPENEPVPGGDAQSSGEHVTTKSAVEEELPMVPTRLSIQKMAGLGMIMVEKKMSKVKRAVEHGGTTGTSSYTAVCKTKLRTILRRVCSFIAATPKGAMSVFAHDGYDAPSETEVEQLQELFRKSHYWSTSVVTNVADSAANRENPWAQGYHKRVPFPWDPMQVWPSIIKCNMPRDVPWKKC